MLSRRVVVKFRLTVLVAGGGIDSAGLATGSLTVSFSADLAFLDVDVADDAELRLCAPPPPPPPPPAPPLPLPLLDFKLQFADSRLCVRWS